MPRLRKSQLGSRNKRALGAKLRSAGRKLNPWGGPNIPFRPKYRGVGGSRTKQARPDLDRLTRLNYPANQPWAWPVDIDPADPELHPDNRAPQASVDRINTSIEEAYHRAGYQ
jgi:hypothetical protein